MIPASVAYASVITQPGAKPKLLDKNFPKQTNFIQHAARRKALFCTRRSAKSYTGGLYMAKEAQENDGANCLYIGLTRLSAKEIMWKDVLKAIDKRHALGMQFNGTELTATMRNGSVIRLTGVDADESEMEKLLGKKYRLIIIDEAASYSVDLRRLVYGILGPAMVDQGGTICLMGTSGDLTQGLFYDITTGAEPGWELFTWSAHDNPYVARKWKEELEDIRQNRPLFMETPLFKQWYLNQWVIDNEKLVYRFSRDRNAFAALPSYRTGVWQYVLGVDLGYSPDPSAFVLCAFHDHDPNLWVLETFKQTEMDVTDVANKIKEYQKRQEIFRVVIDGSNKQAVQEMQNRHGLSLTASEKTGKVDFIQLMNAEFIQGKIKLGPDARDLEQEYGKLIWALDGEKIAIPRKENPNCANHAADAALYAWRFCYQYLAQPEKKTKTYKELVRDRGEWAKYSERMAEDALEAQIQQKQAEEAGQDFWNVSGMESQGDILSYYLNKKRIR